MAKRPPSRRTHRTQRKRIVCRRLLAILIEPSSRPYRPYFCVISAKKPSQHSRTIAATRRQPTTKRTPARTPHKRCRRKPTRRPRINQPKAPQKRRETSRPRNGLTRGRRARILVRLARPTIAADAATKNRAAPVRGPSRGRPNTAAARRNRRATILVRCPPRHRNTRRNGKKERANFGVSFGRSAHLLLPKSSQSETGKSFGLSFSSRDRDRSDYGNSNGDRTDKKHSAPEKHRTSDYDRSRRDRSREKRYSSNASRSSKYQEKYRDRKR